MFTTISEPVNNVYVSSVYQTIQTLFDKLDYLGFDYTSEQTHLLNLRKSQSDSVCEHEENIKDIVTTERIGWHIPISNSVSSSLLIEPLLLHNSDPHHLVLSFLKNKLFTEKQIWKVCSLIRRQAWKINLAASWRISIYVITNAKKQVRLNVRTKFLLLPCSYWYKRNSLMIGRSNWSFYCNAIPVMGFNSGKQQLNSTKSYLLSFLVNEWNIESLVMKKLDKFISLEFGKTQL